MCLPLAGSLGSICLCVSRWAPADSGWGGLLPQGAAVGWSQPEAVVGYLCRRGAGGAGETGRLNTTLATVTLDQASGCLAVTTVIVCKQ